MIDSFKQGLSIWSDAEMWNVPAIIAGALTPPVVLAGVLVLMVGYVF